MTAMLLQELSVWREKYRANLEVFEFFLGGGGLGVANAADEVELHQMILDMPFTPFSDMSVTPTVNADVALPMAQERIAKVMEMMAGNQ
jgi:hypothetical protein